MLAGRRYELGPAAAARRRAGRQLDDRDVVPAVGGRVTDAIERLALRGSRSTMSTSPRLALVDEALGAIILREAWEVHRGLFERDADGYGPGTRALLELGSQVDDED